MPRALPTSFYFYSILFGILVVANVSVYRTVFAPRVLMVTVLEVGKGDATLIRTPNGKTVLIDTGPDASILRALGTALPPWQRSLNAVVLTSTKKSAIGGLPDVTNRYRIPTPVYFGTKTTPYGTRLALGDFYIEIISPGTFNISYGVTSLVISSSTPNGVYISDEKP